MYRNTQCSVLSSLSSIISCEIDLALPRPGLSVYKMLITVSQHGLKFQPTTCVLARWSPFVQGNAVCSHLAGRKTWQLTRIDPISTSVALSVEAREGKTNSQERGGEVQEECFCDVQIPEITWSCKRWLHVWKSPLSVDQILGFS